LAALINYSATFAVSFLLSFYLQYARGMDPQIAGLVLVTTPAVQALFSSPAGRLSDRIEPRIMASAGMGLTTAGLVMLIFLTQTTHTGFILTSLVIIGLGFALFSSPNTNAVMSSVTKRYYGVASATLGTARNVGMMLSLGIATTIFAIFLGRVEISPEYYPLLVKSISVAFIVFTALCLGGIFASLARGKIR
ncbi:MAG: MFS transporter, partial [Chloroflexota bacterium]